MGNEQKRRIVDPSSIGRQMINGFGLWREPGPNIIKGAAREGVTVLLSAAPTFLHKDVKYILELPNASSNLKDNVEMAGRIFGEGFIVKAIDQDDVLGEVLIACFKDMEYFKLKRMDISEFEKFYIPLEL